MSTSQATMKRGQRWSTANAYLRPAMKRPNLHVAIQSHVTRVSVTHLLSDTISLPCSLHDVQKCVKSVVCHSTCSLYVVATRQSCPAVQQLFLTTLNGMFFLHDFFCKSNTYSPLLLILFIRLDPRTAADSRPDQS